MRVLIVGTVPPPGGDAARALAAIASQRAEAGDVVELLSPNPSSAAHRTAHLGGLLLAARLAWLSRRFDALVLRIEDGVPCREDTSRIARAAWFLALGYATSRFGDVTLRLDSPVPIPGGVGGRATARLWSSAREIVVGVESDREQLLPAPGVTPERLVVGIAPSPRREATLAWPEATDAELRRDVLDVVRARAAADRAALAARSSIIASSPGSLGGAPAVPRRPVRAQAVGIGRLVAARLWRRARRSIGLARG